MKKSKFISNYMELKMKECKLPYGMQWFAFIDREEKAAEKAWKQLKKDTK